MAQVKGKFISLGLHLMGAYADAQKKAEAALKAATGKSGSELDPEGWYDTKVFDQVMKIYAEASITKGKAIVTLGKKVYPTIKATAGLPPHLKTPLDFIKFEADGFLANHQGAGVTPRKFIKAVDKEVVMMASAPGYDATLYEGVFLGILEMCGVKTGKVVRDGDKLTITW
jgi:hypothetical protein